MDDVKNLSEGVGTDVVALRSSLNTLDFLGFSLDFTDSGLDSVEQLLKSSLLRSVGASLNSLFDSFLKAFKILSLDVQSVDNDGLLCFY